MKKCIALFLLVMLVSALLSGCSGDVPDETLETKPTVTETAPETEPETEPEEEIKSPVDVETARMLLSEKLTMDPDRLKLNTMYYSPYSDEVFIFEFKYIDGITYAPLVTEMLIKMTYSLDTETGEWVFHSSLTSLADIQNMDEMIGEWVYENEYSINVTDISDSEVTYDYCMDGISGTATVRYTMTIDGRGGGYNGIKLVLISPAECEQLYFFAEGSGANNAYWCIDDNYAMERPQEEMVLSERAQHAINELLSYYRFKSLFFEHMELQYDRDLEDGYYEVGILATATTVHAPLEVTYSLVYKAVNLGASISYEIVDIKNLYKLEGTWEYNADDIFVKITASNADMDGVDIAYVINGTENKQHYSFAEIVSNYSEDDKYLSIPLAESIEGYDFMYCLTFNDSDSGDWYMGRETKLSKVD